MFLDAILNSDPWKSSVALDLTVQCLALLLRAHPWLSLMSRDERASTICVCLAASMQPFFFVLSSAFLICASQ